MLIYNPTERKLGVAAISNPSTWEEVEAGPEIQVTFISTAPLGTVSFS